MMLAIHACSGSPRISWLDSIIVPAPRREELLQELGMKARSQGTPALQHVDPSTELSVTDRDWVTCLVERVKADTKRLKPYLGKSANV